MAFTGNWACNTLKTGLMNSTFNFASGSFYIALYTNSATLDANTTAYTTANEVVATGYTAGGSLLTVSQAPTIGSQTESATAYLSFANISWSGAITARGALIYKAGTAGAICVPDFGADQTSTALFTVQFPTIASTSAIIRIT